jgi:hypothetical protein
MTESTTLNEYLVLSRGKWDADQPAERIQQAIDDFYEWHGKLVQAGRMKPGERLAREGKLVSKDRIVDGPYTEAKEVIGGYWFVTARSLDEAAELMAQNPCIACGLVFEVRPLELQRASAYAVTNETPGA